MTKVDEADVTHFLGTLKSSDAEARAISLQTLTENPLPDERIAAALNALLDDRAVCVLQLPYQFGEVRWLVAHALAAVHRALGKTGPVTLSGVPGPINLAELAAMATEKNVTPPKGSVVQESVFKYDALRRLNALPLYDVTLNQADPKAPSYRRR